MRRSLLFFSLVLMCASSAPAQDMRYTTASLRLRDAPGVDAGILLTIPRGAAVEVGDCAAGWCEAEYQVIDGYVSERYLARTKPAPARRSDGYINSRGEWVPSPSRSVDGSIPAGASARCRDGTYSYSRSRRGTCSHHGGVAQWL